MNPLRRLFSEHGISASPARTRTQAARRRPRFLPLGEALETRRVLSTFKVNTLVDSVAVNLETGKDASGHISLRSAIEAANARPNSDTILLPAGTIRLTIAGANEDNAATGDLDIKGNVTIKGKRSTSTVIDGNAIDRVFQVISGRVQISGLTIQHGQADDGGGLLNSGGQVTLTSVVVANNMALGSPGADGVTGSAGTGTLGPGTGFVAGAGGAGADAGQALGGGISNEAGTLSLFNSTILMNRAQGGDGGQGGSGGDADDRQTGEAGTGGTGGTGGSGAVGDGGGVYNAAGASISISATTFSGNAAIGGHGGQGGSGGLGSGGPGAHSIGSAGGPGGNGFGGAGGQGGSSGAGDGGGLFNLGAVSLSGKTTTWNDNGALGGDGGDGGAGGAGAGGTGGNGASGLAGGDGGSVVGGAGGGGGAALDGWGGGVLNAGTFMSTAAVVFDTNGAAGGEGGEGGEAGIGRAGSGGLGSTGTAGGEGGDGKGNNGGAAGNGGGAIGGGLFNLSGGIVSITAPKRSRSPAASLFNANEAFGRAGGAGGEGGGGGGGGGGNVSGAGSVGGLGNLGTGSAGGRGGQGGDAYGAGLTNAGTVSFTDITVNFTANIVAGNKGGVGGAGGFASGGAGGDGASGSNGGNAAAGNGGDGGGSGGGSGGGIANFPGGTLTVEPRLGTKKGSKQSKATNLIVANQAIAAGSGAIGGAAGVANAGAGGSPNGVAGLTPPGNDGLTALSGPGIGGGLDLLTGGTVVIDNTTITANSATTSDNEVFGTFTT
jgi:hypothetical protein